MSFMLHMLIDGVDGTMYVQCACLGNRLTPCVHPYHHA